MQSSTRSEGRSRRGDRGQATVELALCLPLVCLVLLGVVQVAVVVRGQLAVQLAARDASRAAAVSADAAAAAHNAAAASGLGEGVHVDVLSTDLIVTATVTYAEPTDIPLIGLLLPDLTLRASATMVIEPPSVPG